MSRKKFGLLLLLVFILTFYLGIRNGSYIVSLGFLFLNGAELVFFPICMILISLRETPGRFERGVRIGMIVFLLVAFGYIGYVAVETWDLPKNFENFDDRDLYRAGLCEERGKISVGEGTGRYHWVCVPPELRHLIKPTP